MAGGTSAVMPPYPTPPPPTTIAPTTMKQREADLLVALSDLNVHFRLSLERIHTELGELLAGINTGPSPEADRAYRLAHLESLATQLTELVRNDQVIRSLPIGLGPNCEVLEHVDEGQSASHQPLR